MSAQKSPPRGMTGSQPDLSKLRDEVMNINLRKRKTTERDCDCDNQEKFKELQDNLMHVLKSTLETHNRKMETAFGTLRNDLSIFKQEMRDISLSIQKLTEEQKQIKTDLSELKLGNTAQTRKMECIDKETAELRSTITQLSEQLQVKEQQGRINNLEISGVPILKGENLMNIVNNIAAKTGFSLLPHDIDYIHRVRRFAPKSDHIDANSNTQTSSIPNIIVRFTQRTKKNEMLAAIRARRGLTTVDAGLNGPSKPIFVNDHLTPQNKLLYKQARLISKEKGYKYIWLSECKILLRKNDTSKVLLISSECDLSKIK